MQPIIGVTMSLNQAGEVLNRGRAASFIWNEYGENIRRAGGQPIFLDYTVDPDFAADLCNGIVISGGEDMSPEFYGEEKNNAQKIEPSDRVHWERRLIDECDKREKPVLGICYGAQLLNVHYGGTLYQDIYIDDGAKLNHGTGEIQAYHDITFETDFLGFTAGTKSNVASRHHQAVKDIAPGFEVVARADDGIIEAIRGRSHYGLQWHAESDKSGAIIYKEFAAMCSRMANPIVVPPEVSAATSL